MKRIKAWGMCLLIGLAAPINVAFGGSIEHLPDGRQVIRGAQAYPAVAPQRILVDLRTLPAAPAWRPGDPIKEIPRRFYGRPRPNQSPVREPQPGDPLLGLQAAAGPGLLGGGGIEATILNFDSAMSFTGVQPPDPSGAIGRDHYIEAINGSSGSQVAIYDKTTGATVSGPFAMESLAPAATPCASGAGDPIVFWDALAERFVITEFTSGANVMCVYVQIDPDDLLAGGWYAYAFTAPNFPDYPKYGAWPDAYYVGSNEGSGSPVYAFERDKMILGQPATMQRFVAPDLGGFGFQLLVPAQLDGTMAPPVGTPGLFMRHRDDESHNPGSNDPGQDFLEIWEFSVDWITPANSSLTGPTNLAISEFDSDCNGLFAFNCFPQPSGQKLDPLREPIMWPLQYRNFGSHETLVANLMTDVDGNDHGGVRWFELRRTGAANPWTLHQEGTLAPDDTDRWMGSAGMDESGNIAVGYSVVHQTAPAISAGIRYAGRLASDPAGTLPQGEFSIVEGTGSQSGERWGDYASMTVDPVDGCTFWYTNEYVDGGPWQTRIASFRFDSCGEPAFLLDGAPLEQSICAPGDLDPVDLTIFGRNGYAETVDLAFDPLPTGFSAVLTPAQVVAADPAATATADLSVDATAAPGTRNLILRGTGDDLLGGTLERTLNLVAHVFDDVPGSVTLLAPANGALGVFAPTFSWEAANGTEVYRFELATDPGFTSLVVSQEVTGTGFTPALALDPETTYYWRVTALNTCGDGVASPVFQFTTRLAYCFDGPVAIPDSDVVTSLMVSDSRTLSDMMVALEVTHTWVGDLVIGLRHADTGTLVNLIDQPGAPPGDGCASDDIDALFSDDATTAAEDQCEIQPAITGEVQPNGTLADFAGESLDGTWELLARDEFAAADDGTVDRWCLMPVVAETVSVTLDGSGSGSVTSEPAGIACPGTCDATFPATGPAILTAVPDAGSRFSGWSGDCTGFGACSVILDQPRSVTASFILVEDDDQFADSFED